MIRKYSTNELGLRMVKALPFIHQPDREAQLISDIKHTWKISYLLTCVVTDFLGAINPRITPQFI